jgi:hypothetical protein
MGEYIGIQGSGGVQFKYPGLIDMKGNAVKPPNMSRRPFPTIMSQPPGSNFVLARFVDTGDISGEARNWMAAHDLGSTKPR